MVFTFIGAFDFTGAIEDAGKISTQEESRTLPLSYTVPCFNIFLSHRAIRETVFFCWMRCGFLRRRRWGWACPTFSSSVAAAGAVGVIIHRAAERAGVARIVLGEHEGLGPRRVRDQGGQALRQRRVKPA